jgi:hypothetical protein
MNSLKDMLNYPILTVNAGTFLYIMGIFTGISLGFWAGFGWQ